MKNIEENMKAKLVKENLNEYNSSPGPIGAPLAGARNTYGETRELVDRIGDLEELLLHSTNHKASMEWERISSEYLYPNYELDLDPDDEEWEDEPSERYWDDLEDNELLSAIDEAEELIKKYSL